MTTKAMTIAVVVSLGAGFVATGAVLTVSPADAGSGNVTPRVVAAVRNMGDGDVLRFAKGEYHFHPEGTTVEELAVGSTSWGRKRLVFGFGNRRNVTIDGGGSVFVWHGDVFPFSFESCDGVVVSNFTARAYRPSYAEFKIESFEPDGSFNMKFADGVDFEVTDGALCFNTDIGRVDSRNGSLSFHALERVAIHYLFAANETSNRTGLPSTFMNGRARNLGGGRVRIENRRQNLPGCLERMPYRVGEPLCILLNGRERCSLRFSQCRDVLVKDIHLECGDGMGIVSFMNENFTVDGYRVEPRVGANVTTTADCLFVVNNRGLLEVKNSTFSWALDDALNIHGNYMRLTAQKGRTLELEKIHRSYYNFVPFRALDRVEFIDPKSRRPLAVAMVESVAERDDVATVTFKETLPSLPKGTLAEDVDRVPEVRLHHNRFHDVLHLRLAGRGKFVLENNVFARGCAILINDLATYWGEAGGTKDVTIANNLFDRFSCRGGNGPFIQTFVEGSDENAPPKIHEGIRIVNNRVRGLRPGVAFASLRYANDPEVRDNVVE